MAQGVEWALHCLINLSWLDGRAATARAMADFYALPPSYLHKQVQALVHEGLVVSAPGRRGGYALGRDVAEISLLDVVVAIEGREPAFRCTEIRHRGVLATDQAAPAPADDDTRCLIDQAMQGAEVAWRRELAARSLATIRDDIERRLPDVPTRTRQWFLDGAPSITTSA